MPEKGVGDAFSGFVLAIARTASKTEDFRALIVRTVPNDLKVDTRNYGQLVGHHEDHVDYRAIVIEIDTPSAVIKPWTS